MRLPWLSSRSSGPALWVDEGAEGVREGWRTTADAWWQGACIEAAAHRLFWPVGGSWGRHLPAKRAAGDSGAPVLLWFILMHARLSLFVGKWKRCELMRWRQRCMWCAVLWCFGNGGAFEYQLRRSAAHDAHSECVDHIIYHRRLRPFHSGFFCEQGMGWCCRHSHSAAGVWPAWCDVVITSAPHGLVRRRCMSCCALLRACEPCNAIQCNAMHVPAATSMLVSSILLAALALCF